MKSYKTLFLFLILFSCKEKVYELQTSNIEEVTFLELPDRVKKIINNNIEEITSAEKDIYYSTDPTIDFTYGRGGAAENWIEEVHSNYHHFFIEGAHYKIKGNRGHPFILHDNYIYFCDLNLYEDDYKSRPYYKIKIPNIR